MIPAGRKVRARHDLHDAVDAELGGVDEGDAGVDDLGEVVGGDVGGHADRDPRGAVDEQVGEPGREDRGLDLGAVVVGGEIDRFPVDVGEQLMRHLRHAHFGVAHRRGRVAVDGAEVPLPVDEHHPHRERLRHAHERVVHRAFAVGVVFADGVADDPGRFLVGLVPVVPELAHRVEHAPVDRLQAVSNIRERPAHDHTHGVIEVGLLHLLLNVYLNDFLSEISHIRVSMLLPPKKRPGAARAASRQAHDGITRSPPNPRGPSPAQVSCAGVRPRLRERLMTLRLRPSVAVLGRDRDFGE